MRLYHTYSSLLRIACSRLLSGRWDRRRRLQPQALAPTRLPAQGQHRIQSQIVIVQELCLLSTQGSATIFLKGHPVTPASAQAHRGDRRPRTRHRASRRDCEGAIRPRR